MASIRRSSWGASTASPFTYEYDISGLGLGAANKLKITVATTGANLNNGGNNGIAVVGGSNTSWWDNTHFPSLWSGPTAVSGATRQKQIPSSQPGIQVI